MSDLLENPLSAVAKPIAEQINLRHADCVKHSTRMAEAIVLQANLMREVGLHLLELKKVQAHGTWLPLFATARGNSNSTHVLNFDYETGRRYMHIATLKPDEEFTDAQEASTAIKKCTGREVPQRIASDSWVGRFTTMSGKFRELISVWQEKDPIDNWSREQARAADLQLEPLEKQIAEIRQRVRLRL